MNSIEHATRYSRIGILRKIFYKIPSSWYNKPISSSEISIFNNCDVRRKFHKTILRCTLSEHKEEEDVLDKLEIKKFKKTIFNSGPDLKKFMPTHNDTRCLKAEEVPYLKSVHGQNKKVFIDVYGCQMNVNDAEVVLSILKSSGYDSTSELNDADVILVLTCAIREGAEQKIWQRLQYFRHLINKKKALGISTQPKIGLLGCMAERLKHKILEQERIVDVVAGPDSYKDLPRLLSITDDSETAINVVLSFDETYADVTPVRLNSESVSAFVTIMRGCDNMCTYCIVPFTRGKERSRPIASIEDEIRRLSDQGVKEVTLLGQNVNSYRDESTDSFLNDSQTHLAKGFKTVYKNRKGGLRFSDLLDKVSLIDPNMRIRFTSPHPKDFPDEVLQLIVQRPNICKQLHLPAQSGNSVVLERMRRGYTREAYLELVQHVRNIIPNVYLSSDFIAGFCGETESEFEDTLSLMQIVKYNCAYLFAYSMREKTAAHRRYQDDVEKWVKKKRIQRMNEIYRTEVKKLNDAQIGQQQLILIEGVSRKNPQQLVGRNDGNVRVIMSNCTVQENKDVAHSRRAVAGDYVVVQISDANSQTLRGIPLYFSSITDFKPSTELKFRTYSE